MKREDAARLRAEGLTLEAIGKRLGGISRQRVYQLLHPQLLRTIQTNWVERNSERYNAYQRAWKKARRSRTTPDTSPSAASGTGAARNP